jgi:hypothetical protein
MGTSEYKGFILTGIDLFSKKAWAIPLKNKEAGTVAKAIESMFKQMKRAPSSVRSDRGSEFISAPFRAVLDEHSVRQVLSLAGKPQSNGQVERFNGILKRLIAMNRSQTDKANWVSALPRLIKNYNNSYQRVIKATPNEVEAERQAEYKQTRAKKKNAERMTRGEPPEAAVGATVRLKLINEGHSTKGYNFSREIYKVKRILRPRKAYQPNRYKLETSDGVPLTDVFYRADFLVIPADTRKGVKEPQKFAISSLVRPAVIEGRQGYIIHWRGYPASQRTFEPRLVLLNDVPKLVHAFERP